MFPRRQEDATFDHFSDHGAKHVHLLARDKSSRRVYATASIQIVWKPRLCAQRHEIETRDVARPTPIHLFDQELHVGLVRKLYAPRPGTTGCTHAIRKPRKQEQTLASRQRVLPPGLACCRLASGFEPRWSTLLEVEFLRALSRRFTPCLFRSVRLAQRAKDVQGLRHQVIRDMPRNTIRRECGRAPD